MRRSLLATVVLLGGCASAPESRGCPDTARYREAWETQREELAGLRAQLAAADRTIELQKHDASGLDLQLAALRKRIAELEGGPQLPRNQQE